MAEKARPVLAIVGSPSLLGREVRDLLAEKPLPVRLKLIGAEDEDVVTLTEHAGEPVVMTALDEDNLSGAQVVLLAGSSLAARKALEILARAGARPALVDLTGAHEDSPRARLRAPMVEPADFRVEPEAVHVVAHPAAIALALFFRQLARLHGIRRSVAHIFEPASERGRAGIEELKQQTVNLLTFKGLPKEVFDEQLGFNILVRYGSQAPEALEGVELRIERHLASLLAAAGGLPMPSLRLIQAPVFHGYSFSVWAEFERNPGRAELERALACPQIDVRGADLEAPTAVGFAGQSGIAVGAVETDRNQPHAAWFWIVADNLRIAAENALAVAAQLLGTEEGA